MNWKKKKDTPEAQTPEAAAAACRHDDAPDAQLLHTATVLSLVVYQLQYAPSIGKWSLFTK